MTKTQVFVLDDVDRWVGEFRLKLEEAGFDCLYSTTGEGALATIQQDYHHAIKVVLTDELLKVDGLDDGEKQRFQGRDVRSRIHRQRPDIQFIIISDLPIREGRKQRDVEQGIQVAVQLTAELSQGARVIGMLDKYSLENPETRHAKYQWLFSAIREAIGESKAPVKPGLFIGLGLAKAQFVQMTSAIGVSEKSEIRLHEFLEKITPDRFSRKRQVDEFLMREKILGQGVKDFLQALPQKFKEREVFLGQLQVRLDRMLIRRTNSLRLTPRLLEAGSSEFRILMMLAWKAERGDEVMICETDYVYQNRPSKVLMDEGLGGLSEYSQQSAILSSYRNVEDLYGEEDGFDPFDAEDTLNEHKVRDDIAYGWGDDKTPERIAEVRSARSKNPLKTPVCRFNKYLKHEKIGTLNSTTSDEKARGERRLSTCYIPTFKTGIYLYPVDVE